MSAKTTTTRTGVVVSDMHNRAAAAATVLSSQQSDTRVRRTKRVRHADPKTPSDDSLYQRGQGGRDALKHTSCEDARAAYSACNGGGDDDDDDEHGGSAGSGVCWSQCGDTSQWKPVKRRRPSAPRHTTGTVVALQERYMHSAEAADTAAATEAARVQADERNDIYWACGAPGDARTTTSTTDNDDNADNSSVPTDDDNSCATDDSCTTTSAWSEDGSLGDSGDGGGGSSSSGDSWDEDEEEAGFWCGCSDVDASHDAASIWALALAGTAS